MRLTKLPIHLQEKGWLVAVEGSQTAPFSIARIFFVQGNNGIIRGKHAHKLCSQFLICSSGKVLINCTDGSNKFEFLLDQPNLGLLIPPGIWSEQNYLHDNTVLTVLCDRPYEVQDYIHKYSEFLSIRKVMSQDDIDSKENV